MSTLKIQVNALADAISEAVQRVDSTLREWKVKDEERVKATLTLEELLVRLSEVTAEGECIMLRLSHSYRSTRIRLSCRGHQLNMQDSTEADTDLLGAQYGPEVENMIRDIILRKSAPQISVSYNRGVNKVRLNVHKNDKVLIYDTLLALVLSVITAIAVRLSVPADGLVFGIVEKVYTSLYTIFLRAILSVIGPMVFFSLAACICSMKDISSLGRAGVKIFSSYMLTTFCAIFMVLGFNALLTPGAGTHINVAATDLPTEAVPQSSLLETLLNIVPDNILGAFVHGDMLQILFLGIVVGVAATGDSRMATKLRGGIEVIDHLMQKLIGYTIHIMPLAVFGAMGNMILTLDVRTFGVVGEWFGVCLLLMVMMQFVYWLLLFLFTGLKPSVFARKFTDAQITALSTGSSCATMPVTMKCCQRLGISPNLYNFSIPLGATVNMDGTSITLAMTGLFLATLTGVPLDSSTLTSLVITVVMLSVAMPGVAGGGTAALVIVLASLGVPASAITLVMGLIPFFEIATTVTNVTGDAAVSLIVAKSENMLDVNRYYQKE